MSTKTRTKTPIMFPDREDRSDLVEHFTCEQDDGTGTHKIELWEIVTTVNYGMDDTGHIWNLDQDWEVLWFNCTCGHQTYC